MDLGSIKVFGTPPALSLHPLIYPHCHLGLALSLHHLIFPLLPTDRSRARAGPALAVAGRGRHVQLRLGPSSRHTRPELMAPVHATGAMPDLAVRVAKGHGPSGGVRLGCSLQAHPQWRRRRGGSSVTAQVVHSGEDNRAWVYRFCVSSNCGG